MGTLAVVFNIKSLTMGLDAKFKWSLIRRMSVLSLLIRKKSRARSLMTAGNRQRILSLLSC